MYSVDDIIENLDRESNLEEDVEAVEEDDEQNENDNGENDENSKENEATKPKKTRAKRDIPKLDAQRLRGPRGLTALGKMFEGVKFKGDGYEKEDLNKVMITLHHWCHRLFPKFTFDDTLAQLEKLGANKSVATLKKSIRMGIMDEPEPPNNDEVIDEPMEEMNEFDALLEQEEHVPINIIPREPSPIKDTLTVEQKEIIARNRVFAAERRRARLEAQKSQQSQNSDMLTSLSQMEDVEQAQSSQNFESEQHSSQNNMITLHTSGNIPVGSEIAVDTTNTSLIEDNGIITQNRLTQNFESENPSVDQLETLTPMNSQLHSGNTIDTGMSTENELENLFENVKEHEDRIHESSHCQLQTETVVDTEIVTENIPCENFATENSNPNST